MIKTEKILLNIFGKLKIRWHILYMKKTVDVYRFSWTYQQNIGTILYNIYMCVFGGGYVCICFYCHIIFHFDRSFQNFKILTMVYVVYGAFMSE